MYPRLLVKKPTIGKEIELDVNIHTVDITAQKQTELQNVTEADDELRTLKEVILNGWPDDVKSTPKIIRNYWSLKECLSVQDGHKGTIHSHTQKYATYGTKENP